jgi:16S rRNA (guanine(966)-N(2))-methyltransferase RsmD
LRIIAGKYKSRKINAPAGTTSSNYNKKSGIRPTSDRARESLFNILYNLIDFDEVVCLDLFAGTGALGLECISRGASRCDFIDISKSSIELIKKNSEGLGCEDKVSLFKDDALRFVQFNEKFYDIIFADPPYLFEEYGELIKTVLKKDFGIFVIEYGAVNKQNILSENHDILDRAIGTTYFRIYISKDNE